MEKAIKRKQKNDNCVFLPPSFHVFLILLYITTLGKKMEESMG